ncbi:uncharacterized protein LOC135848253 isoform X5 [Planococcus citri]|uniref:uncharacterized protein LOC135848253 isoform X5 n=1 Tax=Planococcus citri TaxID=170843 RepID=UPI0031F8D920
MAEIPSDHVYDAAQSTLVTLKELSVIAVALKIWRCEINKYRTNDELEKFSLEKLPILLQAKNPDLPTAIDTMIRKYVSELGRSIDEWLKEHHKRVLSFHYSHRNYILEDFDDFVCDYDGTVDYAKTAERMMGSDKLGKTKKFKIACAYFLEDYVRRVWPSVCKKIGLHCINFGECPELYYWIFCCLRNELDGIPTSGAGNTVDEEMLDHCMPYNRSSVEYFWNRVPYENQVLKAVRLQRSEMVTFIKFVLPKFDDHQLDEFVNNGECDLMHTLLKYHCLKNERLICQTWMRIRNIINERNFVKLVMDMFKFYNDGLRAMGEHQYSENWAYLCREIWHSAPHGLRRSAIDEISSNFWNINVINRDCSSDLLLTLLTCVTFEERSLFWSKCWPNLIACKNNVQLQQIMEICFENGDAIIRYKHNIMATSERLQHICNCLLHKPDFNKLNDLVTFLCLNEDTARLFKQKLLESYFLCEKPPFRETHFGHAIKFNEFINDAYENSALAINFKRSLMSIPMIRCFSPECWGSLSSWCEQLVEFMAFIETFISIEGELKRIKRLVIDHWKKTGIVVESAFYHDFTHEWSCSVDQFLLWCLGSNEEVGKFKQADLLRLFLESDTASGKYMRNDVLHSIINDQWSAYHDQIFLWCLGSEEEFGKFKQTCAQHFKDLGLLN